jgi:hypothetical protein
MSVGATLYKRANEMPLSDQESRCVELTCGYLSSTIGGSWTVESYPDELYPAEPTPEVIVTNGSLSAAVEVKQLTGDLISQEYLESLLSNEKFLVPSCGGYYILNPPVDFRLPMATKLRRHIKREIERLAPTLRPGEAGAVRVPRDGHISLISESGPPYVCCNHGGPFSELLRPLQERVNGKFMLVDEGLEHSFVTDEGRIAFYDAVVAACERRLKGDASPFSWCEEWELKRTEDSEEGGDDEDGVWIFTAPEARKIRESVAECVYAVLTNALRKFAVKRWADLHVLVLEESIHPREQSVTEVVAALEPDDIRDVDLVLLVAGSRVVQCYPSQSPPQQ